MSVKVTFLGTGTSTGVPVIGCRCKVCTSENVKNRRLRQSVKIEANGKHFLIDTTPDLRAQLLRDPIPRLDFVLFTHSHSDHLMGLDDIRPFNFRQREPIHAYANAKTAKAVRRAFSYIWSESQIGGGKPQLELHEVEERFAHDGVEIIPLPVLHGDWTILGYRVGNFAYITDTNGIPAATLRLLKGVEVLALDGLRPSPPHPTHFTIDEAIAAAREVGAKETYLIHLPHSSMKAIPKTGPLNATVTVPPSKSYSVRALLLGAMTEGTTTVTNCLDADDTRYALEALRVLGFNVAGTFKEGVVIGERQSMSANEVPVFVGNAGTAMRFLTGWLAFTPGRFLISGEERMHQRPIGDLVDVLLSIGAEVEYVEGEGYPPLRIRGKKMRGGFDVPIAADTSSQFVSALMLGGATLPDGITLHVERVASGPYIDITADILESFGARVQRDGDTINVRAGRLHRDEYRVEGDYSSASYWFAAAAATGGTMRVRGLAMTTAQGDAAFLDILAAMGCHARIEGDEVAVTGPTRLGGGTFDCSATPDIVPTLAAIAPLASEPVEITNVANLRVKESDRLATITTELRRLGATVDERPDSLLIQPGWSSEAATIQTHKDHRIAMSFAISGLARGNMTIADEAVVAKSYPRFWRTLDEAIASKG